LRPSRPTRVATRYPAPALLAGLTLVIAPSNVIVQPCNRGTAHGVLLTLLRILERDPVARIVFLPADHYVRDECGLAGSVRDAASALASNPEALVLLGIEPEEADPDLGYIVPGRRLPGGLRAVERSVEKPPLRLARELVGAGALWNSFIFAGSGPALLGLLRKQIAASVEDMATALARDARSERGALTELYQRLPSVDFSAAVIQGAESSLRLKIAPACGWSDLGSPRRVADTLRRLKEERREPLTRLPDEASVRPLGAFINLAAQHARLGLVK
jgi:mannose-1-phosphate guanylyltransferase